MNAVRRVRAGALCVMLAIAGGCVVAPPAPPPDIVRLQNERDRLHADPVIAANGGAELANADAAVDTFVANSRALDPESYQQGVYLADKLLRIAEASARAREAERRSEELGIERDRLQAQVFRPRPMDGTPPVPSARERLFALQARLAGVESRVDERGLVVRLAAPNFRADGAGLTAVGEQSLASLARALDGEPAATIVIVASEPAASLGRAAMVRDYLEARGVLASRLSLRDARDFPVGAMGDEVVVVVRE